MDSSNRKRMDWGLLCLSLGVFLIPIMVFTWYIQAAGGMPLNVADWGSVGDFVGGVSNPVLTVFSVVLLIWTLTQNREALRQSNQALEYNREELKLTRLELAKTAEASLRQAQEIEEQNQAKQLFQMQEALRSSVIKITDEIDRIGESDLRGQDLTVRQGLHLIFEGVEVRGRADISNRFVPAFIACMKLVSRLAETDRNDPVLLTTVVLLSDDLFYLHETSQFEMHLSAEELARLLDVWDFIHEKVQA